MKTLTTVNRWEDHWRNLTIPQIHRHHFHELHRIFERLLPRQKSFIEIGCAPGSWMAYFAKQFNYSVSGIEYAPDAAEFTVRNMEYLKIPAKIFVDDFLSFKPKHQYDVVFSAGFIEHFDEPLSIISRIVNIANPNQGIIITTIPNSPSINSWIMKTFMPKAAAEHFPISLGELIVFHESLNLETLYANYFGCLKILQPIAGNDFALRHKCLAKFFNFPFRCWNKAVDTATRVFKVYPKIGVVSPAILYIGRRT